MEAPASARASAQQWCQGGVFMKVNVNTDDRNFIVNLQFSKKGIGTWERRKAALLEQFRGIADEISTKAEMNVAFSLHDPSGQMVGGCARQRTAMSTTCR